MRMTLLEKKANKKTQQHQKNKENVFFCDGEMKGMKMNLREFITQNDSEMVMDVNFLVYRKKRRKK